MKKSFIPYFIFIFFFVIYALRLVDSLVLRTDQGPIGELFSHKLAGIVLLILAVRFFHLNWNEIGFRRDTLLKGVITGVAIACPAFITAYIAEIIIALIQGKSPSLQFYVTSYNITGNRQLDGGLLLILICIIGNIINVIMENGIFNGLFISTAEKRYSFAKANVIFSSMLFGFWHCVMPLRNYLDGDQSGAGAIMTAIMFFATSFILSIQVGMQYKIAGSLWDGMVVHFINNVSVNMLHVVSADGTESDPTMRLTISGTIMFIIILVRWFLWKKHIKADAHFA